MKNEVLISLLGEKASNSGHLMLISHHLWTLYTHFKICLPGRSRIRQIVTIQEIHGSGIRRPQTTNAKGPVPCEDQKSLKKLDQLKPSRPLIDGFTDPCVRDPAPANNLFQMKVGLVA